MSGFFWFSILILSHPVDPVRKSYIYAVKFSSSIKPAVFLAGGRADTSYETSLQKLELVLSWATLHFVGWVEPTPGFVGFRRTQGPTYILPVLLRNAKPNNGRFRNRAPKVSISIKLADFQASGAARMKTSRKIRFPLKSIRVAALRTGSGFHIG